MRTATEIRDYFIRELNDALPRLDLYGGEIAAIDLLQHLAFIDGREAALIAHKAALCQREAFLSCGVTGALQGCTPEGIHNCVVGSVYAEIAFQMGYLATDRVLEPGEFKSLRSGLRGTCRTRDFTTAQVLAEFGPPSWISGTNPSSPWVFLYVAARPEFGAIAFDFWNEHGEDANGKPAGKFGELPVLRNVRIRGIRFAREFTFTPFGRRLAETGQSP